MGVSVAELEFNLDAITSLAGKLSTVQGLTGPEHDLLLAIFAAAAARAQVTNAGARTSTLPKAEVSGQEATPPNVTAEILKNQLLNAYIPGNYFQAVESLLGTRGDHSMSAQAKKSAADEGGQQKA
jgi:hypothetical protein